jgi:hypothetical protein
VACWEGSTSTPADAITRGLRHRCHTVFDPLWKESRVFRCLGGNLARRSEAYRWLSGAMGLPIAKTHFGMFDADQCIQALCIIDDLIFQTTHGKADQIPNTKKQNSGRR